MKLLISGSSGLVGSQLCQQLEFDGQYEVVRLVRNATPDVDGDTATWHPSEEQLDARHLSGIDAVIHLGGVNIADQRWSDEVKSKIYNSRVQSTHLLAKTMAEMEQPPATFLCASAIGIYGDRGADRLDETSSRGQGFLADVCEAWEHATQPAVQAGIRVVNMRYGMILDQSAGALAQMLTPFKFGVGGKLGSGSQYWSWIALQDVVNAILFCLQNESVQGPVNFVAPDEVTNMEFTKTLGKVLSRPTCLPVPAFAIKTIFGEMGQELMLSSARVTPAKLKSAGFDFELGKLEDAFRDILSR